MYTELIGHLAIPSSSSTQSLTAAAVIQRSLVMEACEVGRIMFAISTATVSTGNIVIAFKQRTAFGVTAGEVTLGSLNIPGGVALGKVYYKDLDSVKLLPGQELVVEVTTAAAGGGAAGAGFAGIKLGHAPEAPVNVAAMVLSA